MNAKRYINAQAGGLHVRTGLWLLRRTDISPLAKLLYARLTLFACDKKGAGWIAWPSQGELALEIGLVDEKGKPKDRLLRVYLKELTDYGLVEPVQPGYGRPNYYRFPEHPIMPWVDADPLSEQPPETPLEIDAEPPHQSGGKQPDETGGNQPDGKNENQPDETGGKQPDETGGIQPPFYLTSKSEDRSEDKSKTPLTPASGGVGAPGKPSNNSRPAEPDAPRPAKRRSEPPAAAELLAEIEAQIANPPPHPPEIVYKFALALLRRRTGHAYQKSRELWARCQGGATVAELLALIEWWSIKSYERAFWAGHFDNTTPFRRSKWERDIPKALAWMDKCKAEGRYLPVDPEPLDANEKAMARRGVRVRAPLPPMPETPDMRAAREKRERQSLATIGEQVRLKEKARIEREAADEPARKKAAEDLAATQRRQSEALEFWNSLSELDQNPLIHEFRDVFEHLGAAEATQKVAMIAYRRAQPDRVSA